MPSVISPPSAIQPRNPHFVASLLPGIRNACTLMENRKSNTRRADYDQAGSIAAFLSMMSRRAFERRFKAATGDPPLIYLQRVREKKAKPTRYAVRMLLGVKPASFGKRPLTNLTFVWYGLTCYEGNTFRERRNGYA